MSQEPREVHNAVEIAANVREAKEPRLSQGHRRERRDATTPRRPQG
jgi:hypothetical protein